MSGDRPYSALIHCDLDTEIAPLVHTLNSDMTVTTSSCSGHGRHPIEIGLYARNDALLYLVDALNACHEALKYEVSLDAKIVWCRHIVGVTDHDFFPTWTLVSLEAHIPDHRIARFPDKEQVRAPSKKQIATMTEMFAKHLPGSGRPLRNAKKYRGQWIGYDRT